ncbi:MAG: hypothetical protein L0241_28835 [Planctomycetia bacterium]|nr:hypothetical protein [Planctomycetia bacterium]
MAPLPIPIQVIYAGLAGTVLALIVATITNRWSLRVFFLLTLRLAIGWHFLFEGLHKIHSHSVGAIETSKQPFSSEPYIRVAPGPLGPYMRKEYANPEAEIAAKVRAPKEIPAEKFANFTVDEQAAECPEVVAKQLDEMLEKVEAVVKAEAVKELEAVEPNKAKMLKTIDADEQKALKEAKTEDDKPFIKADMEKARTKANTDAEKAKAKANAKTDNYKTIAQDRIIGAKALYARWVYGVEGQPVKVKSLSGDVVLTAPQRLEYLEWLRKELKAAEERQAIGLGNGYGTEVKRAAELRTEALVAESDLVRDANTLIADLKRTLNGGKTVDEPPPPETRGKLIDKVTMWFLVGVGACLMAGLFTRLACLLGAGFLVMTYLAHPPFPWYPQPPGTEGNPIFINKNVIECLALLVLMCYPTGRWLGLDALVLRPFCRYKCDRPA